MAAQKRQLMPDIVQSCTAQYRAVVLNAASHTNANSKGYDIEIGSADLRITCSCPAFRYGSGKLCKHIKGSGLRIINRPCGWRSDKSGLKQSEPGACPLCGSPTEQGFTGGTPDE